MGFFEECRKTLEAYVASSSVTDVIEALAGVCAAKAEQAATAEQDAAAAIRWERDAHRLTAIARAVEN